jgi:hypothetical protein
MSFTGGTISTAGAITDETHVTVDNKINDLSSVFDYDLQTLTLISSNGSAVDLTPYMVELNYFEDIFSDTISAKVVISDSIGIIHHLSVDGTEKVVISFSDGQRSTTINHEFRLYSITNRSFDIGNYFESYNMNLCSEELVLSQKYRVCKSYPKKTISDMVTDILDNLLQTKKVRIIEQTYGSYDIVIPSKKIFESINWLTSFAQVSNNKGADMLFYENNRGYNLSSLQSLYKNKPYPNSYSYDPKNVRKESNLDMDFENEAFNILKLEVLNTLDTLNATSVGSFASRLITIDPMMRKSYINDFNYKEYFPNAQKLNSEDVTTNNDTSFDGANYTDRFGSNLFDLKTKAQQDGQKQTGTFGVGPLKLMVTNNNQTSQDFYKNNSQNVKNDFFVEKTSAYRESQISLLNYTRVKIIIPGNSDLMVGTILDLDIFGMDAQTLDTSSPGKREEDSYLSGKYLITAIRHVVNVNRYITVVELAKESNRSANKGIS